MNPSIYTEKEIKILDMDLVQTEQLLTERGAKKVFDGIRTITHLDYPDRRLGSTSKAVKITEEGKIKVSYDGLIDKDSRESIKFTASRKEEVVAFLARLGLVPISMARARRISYERNGVDFDIDCFDHIPPFLEIDIDSEDHTISYDKILGQLGLEDHKMLSMSTPEIFKIYNLDYFDLFKI